MSCPSAGWLTENKHFLKTALAVGSREVTSLTGAERDLLWYLVFVERHQQAGTGSRRSQQLSLCRSTFTTATGGFLGARAQCGKEASRYTNEAPTTVCAHTHMQANSCQQAVQTAPCHRAASESECVFSICLLEGQVGRQHLKTASNYAMKLVPLWAGKMIPHTHTHTHRLAISTPFKPQVVCFLFYLCFGEICLPGTHRSGTLWGIRCFSITLSTVFPKFDSRSELKECFIFTTGVIPHNRTNDLLARTKDTAAN